VMHCIEQLAHPTSSSRVGNFGGLRSCGWTSIRGPLRVRLALSRQAPWPGASRRMQWPAMRFPAPSVGAANAPRAGGGTTGYNREFHATKRPGPGGETEETSTVPIFRRRCGEIMLNIRFSWNRSLGSVRKCWLLAEKHPFEGVQEKIISARAKGARQPRVRRRIFR
jgi:hypothetical protein